MWLNISVIYVSNDFTIKHEYLQISCKYEMPILRTNSTVYVCLFIIPIIRDKRLEIQKFFFIPFCNVNKKAEFEDEQFRSSWFQT